MKTYDDAPGSGLVVEVFQSQYGGWAWTITKPSSNGNLLGFEVPWQSWDTDKVSSGKKHKTFRSATEDAAKDLGRIVAHEIETRLIETFREERPRAVVQL